MSASVPSWCRVGSRVVCIKRDPWNLYYGPGDWGGHLPVYGEICTIAQVHVDALGIGLELKESHPMDWFDADQFRPLITRSQEQDVARFRKLLVGKPERATA